MLIDIDTGKVIERMPYRTDFDALRGRLSEAEFDAMVTRINELIDQEGAEIGRRDGYPAATGQELRSSPSTQRRRAETSIGPRCSSGNSSGTPS